MIKADTDLALVLYRTQLFGPSDIDMVKKIRAGYQVQPLSVHLNQPPPAPAPAIDFVPPLTPEAQKTSPQFFDILNFALPFAPAAPDERDLRARFATIGIGPDGNFEADKLTPEMRTAIEGGMAGAWAEFDAFNKEKVAMVTNLLTEDKLPSYHRAIAEHFSIDDAWGAWVNRWTVEENRHGIALRDYLVVTRAVDPIALEQARIAQVTAGFSPGQQGQRAIRPESMLDALCYVTFQELATRVSHRNTGRACAEPVADELLKRVAADENLHMIFYRGLTAAALDISPDRAMASIWRILVNFQMPGFARYRTFAETP